MHGWWCGPQVSYVKVMQDSADAYAKQLESFKKAVKGKDKDKVRNQHPCCLHDES